MDQQTVEQASASCHMLDLMQVRQLLEIRRLAQKGVIGAQVGQEVIIGIIL